MRKKRQIPPTFETVDFLGEERCQGAGLTRTDALRPLVDQDDEDIAMPCSLARPVRDGVICRRTSAGH